jgi:Tol biopolymer transport system component/DNA-binding winged helix-turn-helix (wHTH) protein
MSGSSQTVQASLAPVRYRFGTFELDAQSAELRRNGVKLRLQEQPFLVLRKLLESAGNLVSREDLRATLWPADTFVDFDTSLNTAIKRLREVLGDSADLPVFIETVPRRGYRFLAPVQALQNGALVPFPSQAEASGPSARRARLWLLFAGGLLFAAVVGGTAVALRAPRPVPRVIDSTQITFDGLPKGNLHARGAYVYFNERSGNQITLVRVPMAGGPPALLDSSVSGLYLGDVSPDGNKLLLGTPLDLLKGPIRLRLMDMASGSVQDVNGVDGNDVSWTPGGTLIFSKGQDVFLADADGSRQRKLLSAPGYVYFMRYSPDGTRLRFSVTGKLASESAIWEARADGSDSHEILTDLTDYPSKCCGDWTPDGMYFLFQTNLNGASKIWAQPEHRPFWSGTPVRPISLTTVPPNFFMGAPTLDSKKLIVTAAQPRAELVRYDSRSRQFVPFLSGISAGDVEGSRDARSLVYVRYPEETLWRAKGDGTEAAQLTGPSLRASLPHWSPDGSRIVFSGSRPGHPWNIFLIPSAGGPAEQLTNGAVADLDPSWSPNGSKLVFAQIRMEGDKQIFSIQMLDLASRRVTTLPGTDGICCTRWSPDGRFLLASHATFNDLLLYEFATQKWAVIAKDLGLIGYMEWANDSKSVLFDTTEAAEPAFYRVRISDLHLETIVNLKDIRRYFGEFGPWSGMAPDGSPLLVRDISNEEVYSLDLQLP